MPVFATFGSLGYGTAALLFALLGLLLLTGWRGRMQGALLVGATLGTALWAAVLALHSATGSVPLALIWALESLRDLAWFVFLTGLLELQLHGNREQLKRLRLFRVVIYAASVAMMLPLENWLLKAPWISAQTLTSIRLIAETLLSIAGLFLVEQVYRNTPWQHRWGIKYLCLGVGALFAFDFFYYADALLFQRLDVQIWLARGAVTALVVPLIGVSVSRNPQWSLDLFVSRKIVMHSGALVAAGVYLLAMALVGYYIRYYGGEWSVLLQIVFFFGAGMVLVVLLFSGQLRSKLKAFVNRHFFSSKYDYREEWLHLISVLSGKAMTANLAERVIYALGERVDSPGGAIWSCTDDACEYDGFWNLSESMIDRSQAPATLVEYLSAHQRIIDLHDRAEHPDEYDDLELPEWMASNDALRLLIPLFHEETMLGFVVLLRPRSRQHLNWESMDLLYMASRQAASYLALDRAARALADARQFEGFNRLSAFVVHDLKNLVAQLSLVARNAERHKANPEFVEDAMLTVRNSVDKMTRLLAQLRSAVPSQQNDTLDLADVLAEVLRERVATTPPPELLGAPTGLLARADRDRLVAVIGHVVQNAQDATTRSGRVSLELVREGDDARIVVSDDGVGMDANFVRERLFKPFDSTKGLTGMGIGAYECREYVRGLGGHVEVQSTPGQGTRFSLCVPLALPARGD